MTGGGAVDIDVTGGEIRTAGDTSLGIYGRHRGAGDVAIDATGVTIATTGEQAYGVLAYIRQAMTKEEDENVAILGLPGGGRQGRGEIIAGTGEGDIAIAVTGGAISTEGKKSIAVWGQHEHEGDLDISVSGGATVATEGAAAHGVFASQGLATTTRSGADPSTTVVETRYVESSGDLAVAVAGGATVTTAGGDAHGVFAQHQGAEGDVAVTIEGRLRRHGGRRRPRRLRLQRHQDHQHQDHHHPPRKNRGQPGKDRSRNRNHMGRQRRPDPRRDHRQRHRHEGQ